MITRITDGSPRDNCRGTYDVGEEWGNGISTTTCGLPTASVHADAGAPRRIQVGLRGRGQIILTDIYAASEKPIEASTVKHSSTKLRRQQANAVFEADWKCWCAIICGSAARRHHSDHGRRRHLQGGRALARKLRSRGSNVLNPEKQSMKMQADLECCYRTRRRSARTNPWPAHVHARRRPGRILD